MCGRFAQKTPSKELKQKFNTVNEVECPVRYNVAPTTPVIVIHETPFGDRLMEPMRWGLIPSWAKDISIGNKMINARAETIEEKPSYKKAFIRRRCIIPVAGFYEWHTETRQPYYFSLQSGPASLAGIWEHWMGADGSELHTCAIITTAANPLMQPIHHRMPVIMGQDAVNLWLAKGEDVPLLKSLLLPYADTNLQAWPISKRVNSPANDTPDLLEAI
jgi:putative SOS response-associated peptidase YedK